VQLESKIDDFDEAGLSNLIRELNIRAPETGNELSDVYPFNLMFETKIGPTGKSAGFLRPETAQSIFMNFSRLLEANGGQLPFAGACVGQAYRNEISPRAGLLRVLEFTLCEVEHFVDPNGKKHPRIQDVLDEEVTLYSRYRQKHTPQRAERTTIRRALETGLIGNETVAYFIARTALFAKRIGLKDGMIRFRQHKEKEMAHYASDCWDMECLTSYGWVECVGIADRSCYDLSVHSEATNAKMQVFIPYDTPKIVEKLTADPVMGVLGKQFKGSGKAVADHLKALEDKAVEELQKKIEKDGSAEVTVGDANYTLTSEMVKFKQGSVKITGESITPNVIEPSFGIGRLLYSVWEQSFYIREGDDEKRGVLSLPAAIAPITCLVVPLMIKPELLPPAQRIVRLLAEAGVAHSEDNSGAAVGRRYARADEIGIPFSVTIDYVTLSDGTVTVRERDSMKQVRVQLEDVPTMLRDLVDGRLTWDQVYAKYPHQEEKTA
jgi:glycyl-tRNA synthetase